MPEMLKDCINLIKDEGSDYEHKKEKRMVKIQFVEWANDSLIDSVSCRRRSNNIERFQTFSGEHTCMLAHHWTSSPFAAHLKYRNIEGVVFKPAIKSQTS